MPQIRRELETATHRITNSREANQHSNGVIPSAGGLPHLRMATHSSQLRAQLRAPRIYT